MKSSILLLIIFALITPCLAQNNLQNPASNQSTRKFDEFIFDDYQERIARFAEALSKEPTAKGYIIAYDSRVSGYCGEVTAGGAINLSKMSLVGRRDFMVNSSRITAIKGGLRDKLMVELFIVPQGANPPLPTPTYEPSKSIRCPCLSHVYASAYVFENTSSPLSFYTSVSSSDIPKVKPIYHWTVSAGKIISGQGTSSISVERPASGYNSITATIEIGGFSSECNLKSSASSPEKLSRLPLEIDEFGETNCEQELGILDNLSVGLQAEPLAQGYIIVYGGKRGKRNEAKARAARMKAYLVQTRGLPTNRIFIIDGGFRKTISTELWLIEKGKNFPVPTPTVNRKEVRFKGTARIVNRSCGYGLY